jgi:hypothetical protein
MNTYHVCSEIETEEKVDNTNKDNEQDEDWVGDVELDKLYVDCNEQHGEQE